MDDTAVYRCVVRGDGRGRCVARGGRSALSVRLVVQGTFASVNIDSK